VHDAAAARLYCPGGQAPWVDDADPAGQKYPAVHVPVHDDVANAAEDPNLPTRHGSHTPAPTRLYEPGGHWMAVADVLPAGQAYPAVQVPLHAGVDSPDVDPKVPAGQAAVQLASAVRGNAPYRPAGHTVHSPAPDRLYRPAGHGDTVALVDPAGHAYPAVQTPLHADVFIAAVAPNCPATHTLQADAPALLNCPAGQVDTLPLVDPAGHAYPAVQTPLHADVFIAAVAPNCPATQALHVDAPELLNCPARQVDTAALVDPAGHLYPALQFPLHADVFIAAVAPNCPAAHALHVDAPELLNCPAGQVDTAALVDPAGHLYPAVQFPLHADVFIAAVAPN
jgi:hypothetical protein